MKKTKLLFMLFVVLAITAVFPTMAFCDLVSDICSEFDYAYRWTIDVDLDSSWEGTYLYHLSNNGHAKLTYILFPDKFGGIGLEGAFVIDGNKECAFYTRANSVQSDIAYVRNDTTLKFDKVFSGDERHPLLEAGKFSGGIDIEFFYNYGGDEYSRFVKISTKDGDSHPILIKPELLVKIEDTVIEYKYLKTNPPSKERGSFGSGPFVYPKAVIREDRKSSLIPRELEIKLLKDLRIPEVEYDAEEIDKAKESDKVSVIGVDGTGKVFKDGKKYRLEVLEGCVNTRYYIHRPMGNIIYDLILPESFLQNKRIASITADGKINVNIALYKKHDFRVGETEEYGLERDKEEIAVVTINGNKDTLYSYMTVAWSAIPENLDTSEGFPKILPEEVPIENAIYTLEMLWLHNFDGNIMYIPHAVDDEAYDLPQFYAGFYSDDGTITHFGLRLNDEVVSVPISEVAIDEEAEITIAKQNFCGYVHLAEPVVEKARAERGAKSVEENEKTTDNTSENTDNSENASNSTTVNGVEYNPDIMFIPVPTEPQGEAVLHPELPLAPKDGDIRITVGGKEIAFDVAPQIEEDRVLVPLRAVFEQLGDFVDWNDETRTAKIIGGDVTIEFVIGETAVSVNGEEKQMDVPAKIISGRTLVPMRFLSEALGYNVIWNEEARIVSVDKL